MFKKILGLLICTVLASSAVISASASEDTAWKTEVLKGLGVYQENPVTYNNFIKSLSGFLYDEADGMDDAEVIARNIGMIGSDEAFQGDNALTIEEACRLAVITLGYKPLLGDDGNYMQKAAELGIADGIIAKGSDRLKEDVAVEILYDMIEAEPMVKTYGGTLSQSYAIAYGDSLLSINRDIYKVKGIMTGTEITSIYGEEYVAGKGSIAIDEISYFAGTNKYDRFLGMNVLAYVRETQSGSLEALAVTELEKKNEVVKFDSDDIINIGNKISYINYYKSEDMSKKVNIAVSPRVIYNGKFLEQYVEDDFRHGTLELIDNNGDNKFDVIKVWAYQTVVVEAVDNRSLTIKNRYRFTGSIGELSLDTKERNISYKIYDSQGAETTFSAIGQDDVLSVAKSRDQELVAIYIADNTKLSGIVAEFDVSEEYVVIEDSEYDLSEDFIKLMADSGKNVVLGREYTFMLDYFGRIAYFKERVSTNYNVLMRVYPDDFGEEYIAVYMDMNGDWYTSKISHKVRIDGVKPQTSFADAMNNLKNECPQVLIFEFNSENKIVNIDKAGNYTAVNETEFCKKPSKKYYFRGDDRYFQADNEIVYAEDDAKVIVLPTGDDIRNKASYKIYNAGSFFKNNREYTVEGYNPDEFMFCDLFTVNQSSEISSANVSKALYVVTGFKVRLVDGEVLPVIEGSVDGFMNLSFVGKQQGIFNNLQIGDVINFSLDADGMIDYVVKKASLTALSPLTGTIYAETSMHAGSVLDINYDEGKLMLDSGISLPFRLDKNMMVTVYDKSEEECESKPISSISRYDQLLVRVAYGKVQEIVCVKN